MIGGKLRALQGMIELRDIFAIMRAALRGEQRVDTVDERGHRYTRIGINT